MVIAWENRLCVILEMEQNFLPSLSFIFFFNVRLCILHECYGCFNRRRVRCRLLSLNFYCHGIFCLYFRFSIFGSENKMVEYKPYDYPYQFSLDILLNPYLNKRRSIFCMFCQICQMLQCCNVQKHVHNKRTCSMF